MDGYVIIGTELDTKQLEQDLKNAKKELAQFQKEEEKLLKEKGKVELQLSAYDEEKAKIKANTDEMMKKAETETQLTNLLQMESLELENLTQKYSKQFTAIDGINDKLKNNQLQQGLINGKIDEANSKLMNAKGYENVKNQLGKISDKTSDVVKKIGRWGLAIFSVRSAYMFIRQLSSTLAQYDTQYGANLEYIRYLLAQAIAPVLQFLVSLAYKLLSYINAIVETLFGVNLFSNASAKNFNKMAGSAKSIEKSLQNAGFDEMNVLTDTSSAGGGAGGATPSLGIEKVEPPKWIDEAFSGIGGIIAFMKVLNPLIEKFGGKLGFIKSLGVGTMVSGITYAISSLLQYLKDGSWENFGKIIQGIGGAIIGLGAIIGSVPVAVAGAIVLIVGTITKYWEQIKGFLQGGIDWLIGKTDWIRDKFGIVGETIYNIFTSLLQGLLNIFDSIFTTIKGVFDGLIDFIAGVFTGDWSRAWEGIKNIFGSVWNGIKGIVSSVWNFIKSVFNSMVNLVKGIVNTIWNVIKGLINSITGGINVLIRGINKINFDVPDWVPRYRRTKMGI